MTNKNTRFLQKALQTLPKLSKNSLIKFCDNLIHEHYKLLSILDNSPLAISIYSNNQLIHKNNQLVMLMQEIPNLTLLQKSGIHSIQDIHKKERVFFISKSTNDDLNVYYFIEQTEYFKQDVSNKTQESLAALETLAAGISHEIKNPLSAIDIHTQLLQQKINTKKIFASPEVVQYLNIVKTESSRLLNVLDTFLDITRKSKPNLMFTDIANILETVQSLLSAELSKKNISFELKMDSVPKIFTSSPLLQQIILDLLRNSIEAVDSQPEKRITLSLKENNTKTYILIIIDDSGVGIDSTLQHRIFDPYFTTKKNGTGLGLTLVKKMCDELNGQILIDKSKLGGAQFMVCLPISIKQKLLSTK